MAYDGTLKFDTSIDPDGFQAGINGISNIASKGIKATMAILSGASAAVGAIGTAAIKVGSDFEAGMSEVAAISGATGDELDKLTEKAKEMGAKTKFSATESANALSYMAMAGWKTEDMLNGLEGIMNLAAASGEDLAATSDIVTDALTAFGLSAADSTHFADILAAASSNANTNVGLMGDTFKYVAPVAGALGYTAEDTAVAIGLMANAGIKASQAGTSLRTVMSRMSKPTDEVEAAMNKLGISLTDNEGNMKSLYEIMQDLREGFSDLSEAEAAEMAAALGGREAMSGLLAIVNASDEDFDKLTNAIYECDGAAQQMADTMIDNLSGQITILKSGLEGLGISLYECVQEPMKDIVKEAQVMVQELQEAFDDGGLDGLVSAVGDVFAQIVKEAADAAPDLINVASDLIQSFMAGINANLPQIASAGTGIVVSLISALIKNAGSLWRTGVALLAEILSGLADNMPMLIDSAEDAVSELGAALITYAPMIGESAARIVSYLVTAILEHIPEIIDTGKQIIQGFLDGIAEEFPGVGAFLSGFFESIADKLGPLADIVTSALQGIFDALQDADPAAMEALGKAAGDIAVAIVAFKAASTVTGDVQKLISTLSSAGKHIGNITGIISKVVEGFQLLSGGAGTFGEVLALEFPKIASFISKVATIGPAIAGVGSVITGVITAVSNFFSMLRDGFSWVKEILMIVGVALTAVGAIILGAPAAVAAVVAGIVAALATLVVVIKDYWNDIVNFFKELPAKIGEVIDSIVQWFEELPGRIGTWLTNTIDSIQEWGANLLDKAIEIGSSVINSITDFFSELPYKIGYALGYAVGTIVQWGMDVVDWVTTEIPAIIEKVATFFSELPGKIWTWLTETVNKVKEWGINLLASCLEAVTNAINAVVEWFSELPGRIWTWLTNTITKVKQWAVDLKNKGMAAAESLVKAVVDGVSSLPGKMKEVGSNIVQGVWDGICAAKDAFTNNVKNFFSGIVDGVKEALDINSPSGEMKREVGRWIPPGVGEGIEESMPELYDQTDEEMAKLAERMKAAVEIETGDITVRSKAKAEHTAETEIPHGGDTYVEEKFEQTNTYNVPVPTPSEVSKNQREAARKLLGGVK